MLGIIIIIFIICAVVSVIKEEKEKQELELFQRQEKKQQEQSSKIINCVPAIDLLCNVALTYETEWTSQKVRLIKTGQSKT